MMITCCILILAVFIFFIFGLFFVSKEIYPLFYLIYYKFFPSSINKLKISLALLEPFSRRINAISSSSPIT